MFHAPVGCLLAKNTVAGEGKRKKADSGAEAGDVKGGEKVEDDEGV